jgi:AraC family transcriptional regulator of adaptative response / DNA-3-methyladenine glycosylase II
VSGAWDRFETALRIIVSQQISLRGARTILGRLVEAFGTPVPGLNALGLSHVFPPAERVAAATERQVAALGMPAARAAAIRGFARLRVGGSAWSRGVARPDRAARIVPGIGRGQRIRRCARQPRRCVSGASLGVASGGGALLGATAAQRRGAEAAAYRLAAIICGRDMAAASANSGRRIRGRVSRGLTVRLRMTRYCGRAPSWMR